LNTLPSHLNYLFPHLFPLSCFLKKEQKSTYLKARRLWNGMMQKKLKEEEKKYKKKLF
jgi:hypothetical protein